MSTWPLARRCGSRAVCYGIAALLLGSCASGRLVDREAVATRVAALPSQPQGVARAVEVQGPQGRLTLAQRTRLIEAIDAQGPSDDFKRHLAALAQFERQDFYAGGTAQLLIDGPATFQAMFASIERARHTVLLESYIVEDAAVAWRLAELLKRKRAQGVQVALIYDDVGSFSTATRYFEFLRDSGAATCAFNPLVPKRRMAYWNLAHRDHRKILAVDGEVAFTGGINISAVYRSGSFSRRPSGAAEAQAPVDDGWRDTQVQLTGRAAAALDALFRETWQRQGCLPALAPQSPLPAAAASPGALQLVAVLPSSPLDEINRFYAMLLTAIDVSRRRVWVTMAYFAPTADMIDALCDAARRGVDVRLILPSQSDFSPVLHAGRSHYDELLAAGVKLYELQGAVLHAKTVVIDGVLSSVGSSNLDWRSFAGNNEITAVVFSETFAQRLEGVFERDQQACLPIHAEAWQRRPVWQRVKEAAAGWMERLW